MGTANAGNRGPLQTERYSPPLPRHHGKKPTRAMEAVRRHPTPHQLQPEEAGRNDGSQLSAEPHCRKAFVGEHDQERKHKRHPVK